MNIEQLVAYCLAKKAVTESFPFDQDTLVFKVGGKMFLLTSLQKWEENEPSLNLKCEPEYGEELRIQYEAITPGYHMSKVHWNTVYLHRDVPDQVVLELIDHSYDRVVHGMTKKMRVELGL